MAYNYYQPYPYPYGTQQFTGSGQQYQQPQQIQNGGFVSVRSIEEAFNWPVAPGNSITFKDENSPYVYTKTKGFSPLEQPIFERYRLVKEEESQIERTGTKENEKGNDAINVLAEKIRSLESRIEALEKKPESKLLQGGIENE